METKIKKGDFESFITAANYTCIQTCIGFIIAITYNSEGNLIEWCLNKNGQQTGYRDNTRLILPTEEQAQKRVAQLQKNFKEPVYCRPYFQCTYKKN